MKLKRGALIPLIFLSTISFVSAQFYRGYGRFSISNFFATIDPQTVTIITFFFIFFALLFYALTKVFKTPTGEPNKGIAGIISLAVSFLIVYGMYRQGFDVSSWFFRIGIPTDFFYAIMPFLLLAFAIILIWALGRKTDEYSGKRKFSLTKGLGRFLLVFGLFIIAIIFFTDIIYEKGISLITAVLLILIGWGLSRKKKEGNGVDGGYPSISGRVGRWRDKRRELKDMKHQPRLNYKRQLAEQKYQRRLDEKEKKRRAKNIAKIRQRRGETAAMKQQGNGRQEETYNQEVRSRAKNIARLKAEKEKQRQREERVARKQQMQQEKEARRQQEQQKQKSKKMINHLQRQISKKDRELQKWQMYAAKGVSGAKQKVKTLNAEIQEISKKMQRYS